MCIVHTHNIYVVSDGGNELALTHSRHDRIFGLNMKSMYGKLIKSYTRIFTRLNRYPESETGIRLYTMHTHVINVVTTVARVLCCRYTLTMRHCILHAFVAVRFISCFRVYRAGCTTVRGNTERRSPASGASGQNPTIDRPVVRPCNVRGRI